MRTIRNANVCVVGGAGFLGSHMVQHLIEDRGCKVVVIDNLCAGRREFVHKDAVFEYADITQSELHLFNIFKRYATRFVFSYAAHPYVPDSFSRPLHVCDVNFMGAVKVINAAQEAGCEAILQVSSAEIYGHGNTEDGEECQDAFRSGKIDEACTVRPHSSYGVAKAAVDSFVQVAFRERRTPCIALRQFNCVGERETHPYIVPEIISQIAVIKYKDKSALAKSDMHDGRIVRLGNNSFRDFLYASDAVRIAVELLERGQFGEVYNLGSEDGVKMYDLVGIIGTLMAVRNIKVERDESRVRPWEIWSLLSCNDKIKQAIYTWPQLIPLEEALRRTIDYYEANGRRWVWETN